MNISVCLCTYNGERYIVEQLKSILSQLNESSEIIISDDSSSDNTVQLIKSLQDSRIRLFENQRFRSPIFNFEFALKQAKNELIFLSDQDDIWVSGKIEVMSSYLETNDIVVCDAFIVDEFLRKAPYSYFQKVKSGPGLIKNLIRNRYLGCCLAFRRDFLALALPFPKDIPMHDIWIGFVAEATKKKRAFISDKLVLYRRHKNNNSTASESSKTTMLKKIQFRWNLIKYLPYLLLKFRQRSISSLK